MKYVFAISCIFFFQSQLFSQLIGGNGEGFTEVYNEKEIPQIRLLTQMHPIVIRWPGGADAKLAFPDLNKPGLGMRDSSIIALYEEFKDENGLTKEDALKKDLKKYTVDTSQGNSALYKIMQVSDSVPEFKLIYALNVMTGTPESNLHAIQILLKHGVDIIGIVAGNETYFSYSYNWEKYVHDFEPILKACQEAFPEIPRYLCIASDIKSKKQGGWDAKVIEYIKSHDAFISGGDVHLYLNNQLKEAILLHPKQIQILPGVFYPQLDSAFIKYIELYKLNQTILTFLAFYKEQLPDKKLICTEFNDKPAEYWSNTIANGGNIFEIFCTYRNDFDALLVHNLYAKWLWATRSPASKLDLKTNGENTSRIGWYALQLANAIPFDSKKLGDRITIDSKTIQYFYFNQAGEPKKEIQLIVSKKISIKQIEINYVDGKYTYSSAGNTGFMTKDSEKSLEVSEIKTVLSRDKLIIPANSFGFVKIEYK